jgi:hypothetical protein
MTTRKTWMMPQGESALWSGRPMVSTLRLDAHQHPGTAMKKARMTAR